VNLRGGGGQHEQRRKGRVRPPLCHVNRAVW
jgi:hypothetical protein